MGSINEIREGRRVVLVAPALAFEGVDPPPVDIGSVGIVHGVKVTRSCHMILVDWDNGTTARHDESELALYRVPV